MSEKLTTWQLLRNKFPENECVLIAEVSDASGFSRSRSLDFMVINLWQSRGLSVTGIERKSNRGDWLKEMKNPQKQENHFKHCDYFYLLTDKDNVARLEEIPETWGWYHATGSIIKTIKQAPKLNPLPIERSLMCAMLRRAATKENYIHVDSIQDRINAAVERAKTTLNYSTERKADSYDTLKKQVEDFEKSSGLVITDSWRFGHPDEVGKAVKALINGDAKEYTRSLQRIEKQVKSIHEGLEQKINALTIEMEPENQK